MNPNGKPARRPSQRLSHRDLDALISSLPDLYAHASLSALPGKVLTMASRLIPSKVITFDKWDVDATGRATGEDLLLIGKGVIRRSRPYPSNTRSMTGA
jgi:hypothetical protein